MHSDSPGHFVFRDLRDVLGRSPTGITVVTVCGNEAQPLGLAVNSFASLSLDLPEILWSIISKVLSRSAFEAHGAFAVNIMSEADKERVVRFAKLIDIKFEGVPVLESALATLEYDVKQMIPCGDHHIIVGSVCAADSRNGYLLVFLRGQFTPLGATL